MGLLERAVKTCHKCGARGQLKTFTFGLATLRERSVRERDSVGCALHLVSAFIPGLGLLALIPKRTGANIEPGEILVLELRVCRHCEPSFWRPTPYEAHPLWLRAQANGFTRFVSQKELDRLIAQRGPQTLADPIDSETHDN